MDEERREDEREETIRDLDVPDDQSKDVTGGKQIKENLIEKKAD